MERKKTNLFIIGAPKCGTTSLYHWLKQHTQVFFPGVKETHFFGTDLHSKKRAIKELDSYLELYKGAYKHKILGDASVFHLFSKDAIDNILDFNEDSKFIVMLRNPIELAVSLHTQYLYTGNEVFQDFEKAWKEKDRRVYGVGISKITEDPQLLNYGNVCKLGEQLERLLGKVNRVNIKIVFLDDLKNKPEKILFEVFNFLNVSHETINLEKRNVVTSRRSIKIHRIVKHLNFLKKNLGIGKLNTGFGGWVSKKNTTKGKKSALNEELRKEMLHYFQGDIQLLSKLTEKDLSGWLNI